MRCKRSGQITLETAIVMPVVMVIVATFMCISLYIHDIVIVKSYGYSAAMENRADDFEEFSKSINKKISRAPLFVVTTETECFEKFGKYKVVININNKGKWKWLSMFLEKNKDITINMEKKLNVEIMYAAKAIYDNFE